LEFARSFAIALALLSGSAEASVQWRWSYQGQGVSASGTFATRDEPNADGFYEITGIGGEADGAAITSLNQAGTAIPGNEGYPVDNLVRMDRPQLTIHGFGFKIANGTYANPFFAAHFAKPDYYAVHSDPVSGRTSEPSVSFTAAIVP